MDDDVIRRPLVVPWDPALLTPPAPLRPGADLDPDAAVRRLLARRAAEAAQVSPRRSRLAADVARLRARRASR